MKSSASNVSIDETSKLYIFMKRAEEQQNNKKIIFCGSISLILCMLLIPLSLCIGAIVIGNNNIDDVCLKEPKIISMAVFLIVVPIISIIQYVFVFCILSTIVSDMEYCSLCLFIMIVLCGLSQSIMFIIGIIELVYSYDNCKNNTLLVGIMITIVILQGLNVCTSKEVYKNKKKY
jgi:hypothetical protein